jgi:hypothetical protein
VVGAYLAGHLEGHPQVVAAWQYAVSAAAHAWCAQTCRQCKQW